MKTNLILLGLSLAVISCSSKKPEKKPVLYPNKSPEVTTTNPNSTSVTAKQVAAEQGTNFVTEVSFVKGQTTISATDQRKIKFLYQKSHKRGEVEEVQLVTWADKEFPTKDEGKLARGQRKLVDKRNEAIEDYLNKIDDDLDVKKISMAERASFLERFTASEEAEVKKTLDVKGATERTGRAMVIFVMKQ